MRFIQGPPVSPQRTSVGETAITALYNERLKIKCRASDSYHYNKLITVNTGLSLLLNEIVIIIIAIISTQGGTMYQYAGKWSSSLAVSKWPKGLI